MPAGERAANLIRAFLARPEAPLQDMLHLEELVRRDGYDSVAQARAKEITDHLNTHRPDRSTVEAKLRDLLARIQPVDIERLLRALAEASVMDEVPKHELVVVVGETGVGKTTTIHHLAGSTLSQDDLDNIMVTSENTAPGTHDMRIGDGAQSTTTSLKAVKDAGDAVMLLDTVGWNDTNLDATDAAASHITLITALQQCRKVWVVLLLDAVTFCSNAMNPVREPLKTLAGMVKNPSDVAPAVTFALTKAENCNIQKLKHHMGVLAGKVADSTWGCLAAELHQQLRDGRVPCVQPLEAKARGPLLEAVRSRMPVTTPGTFVLSLPKGLHADLLNTLNVEKGAMLQLLERGAQEDFETVRLRMEGLEKLGQVSGEEVLGQCRECRIEIERRVGEFVQKLKLLLDKFFTRGPLADPNDAAHVAAEYQRVCVALKLLSGAVKDDCRPLSRMERFVQEFVPKIQEEPAAVRDMLLKCEALAAVMPECKSFLHNQYTLLRKEARDGQQSCIKAFDVWDAQPAVDAAVFRAAVGDALPDNPRKMYKETRESLASELRDVLAAKMREAEALVQRTNKYSIHLAHALEFLDRVCCSSQLHAEGVVSDDFSDRLARAVGAVETAYHAALERRSQGSRVRPEVDQELIATALKIDEHFAKGWADTHEHFHDELCIEVGELLSGVLESRADASAEEELKNRLQELKKKLKRVKMMQDEEKVPMDKYLVGELEGEILDGVRLPVSELTALLRVVGGSGLSKTRNALQSHVEHLCQGFERQLSMIERTRPSARAKQTEDPLTVLVKAHPKLRLLKGHGHLRQTLADTLKGLPVLEGELQQAQTELKYSSNEVAEKLTEALKVQSDWVAANESITEQREELKKVRQEIEATSRADDGVSDRIAAASQEIAELEHTMGEARGWTSTADPAGLKPLVTRMLGESFLPAFDEHARLKDIGQEKNGLPKGKRKPFLNEKGFADHAELASGIAKSSERVREVLDMLVDACTSAIATLRGEIKNDELLLETATRHRDLKKREVEIELKLEKLEKKKHFGPDLAAFLQLDKQCATPDEALAALEKMEADLRVELVACESNLAILRDGAPLEQNKDVADLLQKHRLSSVEEYESHLCKSARSGAESKAMKEAVQRLADVDKILSLICTTAPKDLEHISHAGAETPQGRVTAQGQKLRDDLQAEIASCWEGMCEWVSESVACMEREAASGQPRLPAVEDAVAQIQEIHICDAPMQADDRVFLSLKRLHNKVRSLLDGDSDTCEVLSAFAVVRCIDERDLDSFVRECCQQLKRAEFSFGELRTKHEVSAYEKLEFEQLAAEASPGALQVEVLVDTLVDEKLPLYRKLGSTLRANHKLKKLQQHLLQLVLDRLEKDRIMVHGAGDDDLCTVMHTVSRSLRMVRKAQGALVEAELKNQREWLTEAISQKFRRFLDRVERGGAGDPFANERELERFADVKKLLDDKTQKDFDAALERVSDEVGLIVGKLTTDCPVEAWDARDWDDFSKCDEWLDRKHLRQMYKNMEASLKKAIESVENDGGEGDHPNLERALEHLKDGPKCRVFADSYSNKYKQAKETSKSHKTLAARAARDKDFKRLQQSYARKGAQAAVADAMLQEVPEFSEATFLEQVNVVLKFKDIAHGDVGKCVRSRCDIVLDDMRVHVKAELQAGGVTQALALVLKLLAKDRLVCEFLAGCDAGAVFDAVTQQCQSHTERLARLGRGSASLGPDAAQLQVDHNEWKAAMEPQMKSIDRSLPAWLSAPDDAPPQHLTLGASIAAAADACAKHAGFAERIVRMVEESIKTHVHVVRKLRDTDSTCDSVARQKFFPQLELSLRALHSLVGCGLKGVDASASDEANTVVEGLVGDASRAMKQTPPGWEVVNTTAESLKQLKGCAPAEKIAVSHLARLTGEIRLLQQTYVARANDGDLAGGLCDLQDVKENVAFVSGEVDAEMKTLLRACEKMGPSAFSELTEELAAQASGHGERIVAEQPVFEQENLRRFNEATHGKLDFDLVMKTFLRKKQNAHLMTSEERLRKSYTKIIELFETAIRKGPSESNRKRIVENIRKNGNKLQESMNAWFWKGYQFTITEVIIADLFALWSLERVLQMAKHQSGSEHYPRPHAVQILAVCCALGWGGSVILPGNVVQVGTGEGKSLVLFILGAVSALIGLRPFVVCYSAYLSSRDEQDFAGLYKLLELDAFYGTFNAACEEVMRGGAYREEVKALLRGGKERSSPASKKTCLLIDEVDVFFDTDFYGQSYLPSLKLEAAELKELTDHLWSERTNLNVNNIRSAEVYKVAKTRHAHLGPLFDEVVYSMVADLHSYKTGPRWHVDPQALEDDNVIKLGYIVQDTVDYKKVFDYSTMWAIYDEYHLGKHAESITDRDAKLRDAVYILLRLGFFSYTHLAKERFDFAIGVSGTLPEAGTAEEKLMEDFKIERQAVMPSMYGDCMREFFPAAGGVLVADEGDPYLAVLLADVKKYLSDGRRAVLVLFETEDEVNKHIKRFREDEPSMKVRRMVEGMTNDDRRQLTRKATEPGAVTFATRSYGRGVDFIVQNKKCKDAGGLHVIQAFMGPLSEHTQIQGRAGRQGQKGSFSMVLNVAALEKLHISRDEAMDAQSKSTLYKLLIKKARAFYATQLSLQSTEMQQVEGEHKESMKFREGVSTLSKDRVVAQLCEWNKGPRPNAPSRTVILMDATGSMTHLIHGAKAVLRDTFIRLRSILKEAKLDSDGLFSIQMCCYRSYNCGSGLFESSKWCQDPSTLCSFLDGVQAGGGFGQEAVEWGLRHAMQEHAERDVTQVILIGDAPGSDAADFRRYENRGVSSPTGTWTTCAEQSKLLATAEIPVHAFYMKDWARSCFQQIADTTGGKCAALDVSHPNQLTDLFSTRVLSDIGGEELEQLYRKKFCGSFTG
eukprot:TRINITY_DN274_c0_g1_i10.p1 TRINITY_DN274_c0_g1~~TRINITY_DN274_c0_g1_i10.p1  ORF type:complete len:2904 (+),score=760.56 TRINITY_DN274_c0_g1_i10:5299-14010(+)